MWVTWGQSRWSGTVRVFEDYGTRDMPEVVALGDAIRFQEALGADAKAQAFEDLRGRLLDMVDATPGLRWRSPRGWAQGASLIAVEVEGRDSAEARERLYRDHGVVLRAFSGPELNALRVSPNVMNTEKELETLVRYLQA
jgi:selenocysteine lyase/cysteine desulfurase